MPKRNIYKTPLNTEIHKLVSESNVSTNDEIRSYLKSKYSKSQIDYYLDYRYQEDYLKNLNYPYGKTPTWLRYLFIILLGFGILSAHYLWLAELDFFGTYKNINKLRPTWSFEYSILYGIGYYGSLFVGFALILIPFFHIIIVKLRELRRIS